MKRTGITARIGAVILAAGMVMADIGTSSLVQAQTVGEGASIEVEEELRASANGISKVIGLEGSADSYVETAADGTKRYYVYENGQKVYDKRYQRMEWNAISNATEITDAAGKMLYIGYQVKINDGVVELDRKDANGESFTTSIGCTASRAFAAGESAIWEVRGIYYTVTTGADGSTTYNIVNRGPWSDAVSYAWTMPAKTLPAVTGLAVRPGENSSGSYELTWNPVDEASRYYIEYYQSQTAINPAALTDEDWDTYTSVSAKYTHYEFSESSSYRPFLYFRVRAYIDDEAYISNYSAYSNIVNVDITEKQILPEITGLAVENQDDGTFNLVWNKVDDNADIRVYYTKFANMFNTREFIYSLANPYRKVTEEGDDWSYNSYMTSEDSVQNTVNVLNKKLRYRNLSGSTSELNSSTFRDLEVGTTYYFAVVTYDSLKSGEDRTATSPYVVNGVSYGYYTDVSNAATTSASLSMGTANQPSTKSDKTSITLSFNKRNSNITGYEICRANSKGKYTKITTTTSAQFVDTNLSESTVYNYRARAYHYNKVTKKTTYSEYVYFQAETSSNNMIDLEAAEASKTSVKLKWTKVPDAVKYEIYRTSTFSENTDAVAVSGYGNGAILSNQKWELLKTINKAKTVSYTDKKLKTGMTYVYKVVATYQEGKKTKQIFSTDGVTLALSVPTGLTAVTSGTTVKVSWDADKYASKFEVRYKIYDAQGKVQSSDWQKASVKKNAYSVKNVPAGGYVEVKVRAYAKKWTDFTDTITQYGRKLASAGTIKAVNTTVKDAKGVVSDAVKITWKSVSGAAYYMVYRSTSPASGYNNVNKYYFAPDDRMVLISKESNDDEAGAVYDDDDYYYSASNTVPYDDYKGQTGTIVGTSAIDRGDLQQGVTYYYYVMAYAANGTNLSQGYAQPGRVTFKITVPTIKSVKAAKGKVTVTINKVTGAKSYEVYRSTSKKGGYEKIGTTKKTSYVDKTVKKGKTYYYKVAAAGTNALKADFLTDLSAEKKIKAK